jgi:hypothetical protein
VRSRAPDERPPDGALSGDGGEGAVTVDERIPRSPDGPRGGDLPTLPAPALDAGDPEAGDGLPTVPAERYERVGELGRGGMGRVSIARDPRLGRRVALKELLRPGPDAEARFVREALVTARLTHPAIVPVYEAGRFPSRQPFYAMKLLAGRPLGDVIRGAKSVDERLATLPQLLVVADAIAYAHSRRVVHRDLKPDNIIVGDFGETVVIDWGLAKLLDKKEQPPPDDDGFEDAPSARDRTPPPEANLPRRPSSGTRLGARMGTPGYASPEQSAGLPVDERTDVYALGAILYEILTGHAPRPSPGLALSGDPGALSPPPTFPPGLPSALVAVCKRAMATSPDDRHPTARELRVDLEAAIAHRDAEKLIDEAVRRVDELQAAITAGRDDAQALYGLFGAARFGFEQALQRSPGEPSARAGLERAVTILVQHEIARLRPQAARSILAALTTPPEALVAAVAEAERGLAAEEARRAELVALGHQHDARVGQKTRLAISLVVGGLWTASPLVANLLEPLGYLHYTLVSLAFLVGILALFAWSQEMRRTAVNRALFGGAIVLQISQVLLYAGGYLVGLPIETTDVQHLLVWSIITAGMALALDRRIFVTATLFAGGYLLASRAPWARRYLMSIGNFCLTMTAVWLWLPRLPRTERR